MPRDHVLRWILYLAKSITVYAGPATVPLGRSSPGPQSYFLLKFFRQVAGCLEHFCHPTWLSTTTVFRIEDPRSAMSAATLILTLVLSAAQALAQTSAPAAPVCTDGGQLHCCQATFSGGLAPVVLASDLACYDLTPAVVNCIISTSHTYHIC